ncbi:MAG: glycogen-binding domain-containing protein [Bacteroidales bacterium]|jgi:hypothetical protein
MKNRSTGIVALLMIILMHLPLSGIGQEFLNGVCRIENGRMIFKIDLDWTPDQLRLVSSQFNLDTLLLSKVMNGKADSIMLADGWKWKQINPRTTELSKDLAPAPPHAPAFDKVLPPSRIFLLDDNWLHVSGFPEPDQANYGVNKLTYSNLFKYSDSMALFILPGHTDARQVYLSGTFNEWSTMQTPMKRSGEGWSVAVPLLPGKYAYKYIIDGRWTQDGNNKLKENDLNGGNNSVIFCYNFVFRLKGYTDAKKVILAGSFNNFNPRELMMSKTGEGWELPLYLRPGTHSYKFIIDNNWITDPDNPVVRPDGRGNFNSFMGIGDTTWFRISGHQSVKNMVLAGTFNGWNTAELKMTKTESGWQLPFILAPGNYEYKYIADGRWMTDSANPFVNGKGNMANSFLTVKPNHNFMVDSFPNANRIAVSGSFNGWNREGYSMVRKNNRWMLPLFLKPGKYTYKIIVDGQWILDPNNMLWEENEYGTGNSVLWIGK